jgi:hypothetical protein
MNQINQTNGLRWYALRTRSRHEKVVRDQLLKLDANKPLLPTVKRLSQWKIAGKKLKSLSL